MDNELRKPVIYCESCRKEFERESAYFWSEKGELGIRSYMATTCPFCEKRVTIELNFPYTAIFGK